jgi:hypothetical protein
VCNTARSASAARLSCAGKAMPADSVMAQRYRFGIGLSFGMGLSFEVIAA